MLPGSLLSVWDETWPGAAVSVDYQDGQPAEGKDARYLPGISRPEF